ncbi:hypothetical protein SEPCBS57363_005124 [Sporothrix epigloea]|uniref:Uncharacterized protein n=1 Tax=Sporothrix epigloea TaxID=1892477 RepID=A0ABP0DYR2_9PEZI
MERSGLGRITWWPLSPPAQAAFTEARFFLRVLGRLAGEGEGDGVEAEVAAMVDAEFVVVGSVAVARHELIALFCTTGTGAVGGGD